MNNKEKILNRTLKLMGLVEYNDISMDDIAEYAFVSKMTLYNNFENKQMLRVKTMIHLYTQEMETAYEILNSKKPFSEKVVDIINEKILKYDDKYLRMFKSFDINDPDFQEFLNDEYNIKALKFRNSFYVQARNFLVKEMDENQFWEYIEVVSSGFAHLSKKGYDVSDFSKNTSYKIMINAILNDEQ